MKIKPTSLTRDNFYIFGEFACLEKPEGFSMDSDAHSFYPDILKYNHCTGLPFAFSSLLVNKNDSFQIKEMEHHNFTGEIMMPLNDDCVLTLAPANGGDIDEDDIRSFIIPKNTMVSLQQGVWHHAMLPLNVSVLSVMIGLPQRVYHNDLVVKPITEDVFIEI